MTDMAQPTSPPERYTKKTLPSKLCYVCGRPFTWRKKWARDWDAVTVCSERCRRQKCRQDGGAA